MTTSKSVLVLMAIVSAAVSSAQSASITIGETTVLSGNDCCNTGLLLAQHTTLTQAATIRSLSFYVVSPSGTIRLGIYDATGPGGGPGARKAETNAATAVAGWNTVPVIAPVQLSAGTYWLAYAHSGNSLDFKVAQNGTARYYSRAFAAMPATFSTSPTTGAVHWSLYATLDPAGADTTPPTVTMTAPANATVVNGTIAVSAGSSDDVGVVGVQFTLDAAPLGAEDIAAPYSISWNTAAASDGAHVLTAVARDAAGNATSSSAVSVTVNNASPSTITIGETGILAGSDCCNAGLLLAQQTTLSQTATIQSLSFYVATPAGTLRLGLYDSSGPGGGPGARKAETAQITPAAGWNTADVITPVQLAAGTYWLAYAHSDNGLEFRMAQNGTAKYYSSPYGPMPALFSTTPATGAFHWSLYARLTTTAPPPDTTAPTVSIAAPANGATVSGSIAVQANASDNVGVVGVQFKVDGANLNPEDAVAPYSATWDTTAAANGAHSVTALARDAAGNVTTSQAVNVIVNNNVTTPPIDLSLIPPGRATTWVPGMMAVGGIPHRTTVCATIQASTYGNGTQDTTAGIQAAIDACPEGQVVLLSAGDFLVSGAEPITISKGIVLRGAGPSATRLNKTNAAANPVVMIGTRWLEEADSVSLIADAAKGATSVQVESTSGFSIGELVLLDETTDTDYVNWGIDPAVAPGGVGRGWFTRYDRPVGQMLEIASISGNSISFTTPLHIAFDRAHTAQLTRYAHPAVKNAGIEHLYVRGGQDDNILMRFAMYSWVKHVESDWSLGDSVGIDASFRSVVRDSYFHDTPEPYPGGGGYLLSIAYYTSDSLVENSIFINGNKVMVMRASGGGNVIGYNYFDNGYIGNFTGWMETGLNASHMTCPHFELFEGNQAFNIDGDDTWGGAVYNTFFRNHATGKRRSYTDENSRRAIGLMYGHYYYSFIGNVLGYAAMSPAPYTGFAYEDLHPWEDDPVGLWRLGYTPTDWNAQPEARVVNTTFRHGNYDYFTNTTVWNAGTSNHNVPVSFYLTTKPAFFGSNPWPWVNPLTGAISTLPARQRYDAGTPNDLP